MRVQCQDQHLRLRLQDAELNRLLNGATVENRTSLPDGRVLVQQVRTADRAAVDGDGLVCRVALPADDLHAYRERLPTRQGLDFTCAADNGIALIVHFDVDVRDSVRRHPPKRVGVPQ